MKNGMEGTKANDQSFPILEDGDQGFNISTNATLGVGNGRSVPDMWVNTVLLLMTLTCFGCVCCGILYYNYQRCTASGMYLPEDVPTRKTGRPGPLGNLRDIVVNCDQDENEEEEEDNTHESPERRSSKDSLPNYMMVSGLPTYEQAMGMAHASPVYTVPTYVRCTPMASSIPTYLNCTPMASSLPREEIEMSTRTPNLQMNRTKGVYPNPPLTPPTVSTSRISTRAAIHAALGLEDSTKI